MRALGLALAMFLPLCACDTGRGVLGLASHARKNATMHEPYAYQLAVHEAHTPPLWFLDIAPAGMTLSSQGLLEWTPQYDDIGWHTIWVHAQYDGKTATQTWDLHVHQGVELGTTLSPRHHTLASTQQDWTSFFSGHAAHGSVIAFHTNWRDAGAHGGQTPQLAAQAMTWAHDFHFTAAIGLGWADGAGAPDLASDSDPLDNSWSNAETRAEFLAMVTHLAQSRKPKYLFLGNEVNTYYLTHTPGEWNAWVSEFSACYDAIKLASPNTLVSMAFQLEHLKGLGSATTGWTDPPQWNIVDQIVATGKLDALAFTTFPYFEYTTPAAIPSPYYDEIASHWSGPVIFSELGWLAAPHAPYPGAESDQADFVATFFDRTRNLDLAYATWLFLHDWDQQATAPEIADIGLRNNDASVIRAADSKWTGAVLLRE